MVFTRTDSSLATGFNQQGLYDFIKARFLSISGYTLYHEYNASTDKYMIFEVIFDASKTYGKIYLRVRIYANFSVSQALYTSWNTSTNVGTHASGDTALIAFVNTTGIECVTLNNGGEYRLIALMQTVNTCFLGVLRPANKPTGWDENSYPYAFIYQNQANANFLCPALNAYANATAMTTDMGSGRMSNPHNNSQRRSVIAGIILYSPNAGDVGKTSDDLAIACTASMNRLDTIEITPNVEEYLHLYVMVGAMVFRVV